MFSIDSSRQADACRFCWMCRHICPVSNSTGNEGWTPRARGLMVSMIERGLPYDGEIAEASFSPDRICPQTSDRRRVHRGEESPETVAEDIPHP